MCFVCAVLEGIDLQSVGVAAPRMAPALGITSAQLGWVFSASTIGLLIGALIGGYCADRQGRKRVLIISMLTFGLFSLGTSLCRELAPLLWMRLLTGIGLGGALPNLIALASENSPDTTRGRWVALMYGGIPMGSAVASWIALRHGNDWRTIFWVGGIAPLLVAPLMAWALPESQRFESVRDKGTVGRGNYLALFGANQFLTTLLLWITASLTLLVIYSVFNWLPTLLLGLGLRANQVSGAQLMLSLGGVTGTLFIGVLMDSRWRTLCMAMVYGIAVLLIVLLAHAPAQLAVIATLAFLMGTALQSTTAILFTIAPLCYDTVHRGTGVGIAIAVGRLGAIAGPIVVGIMMAKGNNAASALMGMAFIMLFAMLSAAWVTARAERLGRALR